MAKTNTRKATAKSVLTKEVQQAIESGNRRVLNKALYRLYLAKINPEYKIGDKKAHEQWYSWISSVLDGSVDIREIEALPDKKAKAAKKSTTTTTKKNTKKSGTTKNTNAKSTASDDVRAKLIADYASGEISAEQFANTIIALK